MKFSIKNFFNKCDQIRRKLTKVIPFSESTSKKDDVVVDTFFDFADVSSDLMSKLSAWKGGCTIPFELLDTTNFIDLGFESSYKVL